MDAQLTKYDVFLAIAGRTKPISKEALVKAMWLDNDSSLEIILNDLLKEQLIRITPDGYGKGSSSKGQALLELLLLALAYEYNYNIYLSEPIQDLLKAVYKLNVFTDRELESLPDRKLYLSHLIKDQMILFVSYDPLSMRLARTLFFDLVCSYFNISPKTKFFDTKVDLNKVIISKLTAKRLKDKANVRLGARHIFNLNNGQSKAGIPKMQRLLAYDIIPEQADIFDKKAKADFAEAKKCVERNSGLLKRRLTLDIIKEYHRLATANSDTAATYRKFNVEIKANPYFKTAAWKKIPQMMDKLMDDYDNILKSSKTVFDAFNLAAFFYNEFIHIHPFEDGNSRTAFLCLLHILNLFNTGITSIPASFDYSFIQATKGQRKRNDRYLVELLKEIYIVILNQEEFKLMAELTSGC